MDRPTPRYRPSVLLIIGFIFAVAGLTTAVIDRDWRSAALGAAVLIVAVLAHVGARRRQSRL